MLMMDGKGVELSYEMEATQLRPDPAWTGSDDEQINRFRSTRNEIKKRLISFAQERGLV
jgi:hypothetical protein